MVSNTGDGWQEGLVKTFASPLTGRWRIAFKFWETRENHDGNLWLKDADGEPLIGVGTENPQWEVVVAGEGEVVNDSEHGNDYEHWIHVVLEVDTAKARARVTFDDLKDDDRETYGWFDLPDDAEIGTVGLGPDHAWYVDDIRIRRGR